MLPTQAEFRFTVSRERNVALRAKSFVLHQGSRVYSLSQPAKSLECLPGPFGHALRIFKAARHWSLFLSRLHGENKLNSIDLRQLRDSRRNRRRSCVAIYSALFVNRLGGFQQQAIVGFENSALPARLRWKRFESAGSPGKNFVKCRFACDFARFGVN